MGAIPCAVCSTRIFLINSHNYFMWGSCYYSPLYSWEIWDTERLSFIQLVSKEAEVENQTVWFQYPILYHIILKNSSSLPALVHSNQTTFYTESIRVCLLFTLFPSRGITMKKTLVYWVPSICQILYLRNSVLPLSH